MKGGIECFRVRFPKGQDANDYARMTQPAEKALGLLLNSAAWLGKGQRPAVRVLKSPVIEEEPRADVKPDMSSATSEKPAAKKKKISEEPEKTIFFLSAL